jgi:crossover junction endodeoxyribonuclease RuvC
MTVGEARGVILLALNRNEIAISHYTPLQIKIAITGYGRAEKSQIQRMIKSLLKLDKLPKPDDVSDALAVALTHAYTMKIK